uniref:Uncharacterized protein n=1 Tax=Siphoviridae sp. ctLmu1 TaxID=2826253 RepID=A0A8S5NHR2_9CAUD|nr:MAG TPA: hypothetical protein [Siphoviridae sp. ctLmu1]DAJ29723.1 MAG TPA: hypothetical protein [Caudoviricetes sp.]
MKNIGKWPCYLLGLERYMCYRKEHRDAQKQKNKQKER